MTKYNSDKNKMIYAPAEIKAILMDVANSFENKDFALKFVYKVINKFIEIEQNIKYEKIDFWNLRRGIRKINDRYVTNIFEDGSFNGTRYVFIDLEEGRYADFNLDTHTEYDKLDYLLDNLNIWFGAMSFKKEDEEDEEDEEDDKDEEEDEEDDE